MNAPLMFSSATPEWATPADLFHELSRRFGPFDLDVCALPENAKCERYYTPEVDGLAQPWEGRCWCNPPYGRTIDRWVRRALAASRQGATVVCLLPARTDTRWWQDLVRPHASVTEFLRGRVRFGGGPHAAPFPSAVVVFAPGAPVCRWCERPYRPRRADAKFCSGACKQAAYRARRVTDKA